MAPLGWLRLGGFGWVASPPAAASGPCRSGGEGFAGLGCSRPGRPGREIAGLGRFCLPAACGLRRALCFVSGEVARVRAWPGRRRGLRPIRCSRGFATRRLTACGAPFTAPPELGASVRPRRPCQPWSRVERGGCGGWVGGSGAGPAGGCWPPPELGASVRPHGGPAPAVVAARGRLRWAAGARVSRIRDRADSLARGRWRISSWAQWRARRGRGRVAAAVRRCGRDGGSLCLAAAGGWILERGCSSGWTHRCIQLPDALRSNPRLLALVAAGCRWWRRRVWSVGKSPPVRVRLVALVRPAPEVRVTFPVPRPGRPTPQVSGPRRASNRRRGRAPPVALHPWRAA